MNEATIALLIRGIACVALIGVGFYQLRLGFQSFKLRSELGPEKSSLHFGEFRISSNSVGAFVMGAAFLWGLAASSVLPSYTRGPNSEQVALLPTEVNFPAKSLTASIEPHADGLNSQQVKDLFADAVQAAQASPEGAVRLNGVPASFDIDSLKAYRSKNGTFILASDVSNESASATVTYQVNAHDGKIEFRPAQVSGQKR